VYFHIYITFQYSCSSFIGKVGTGQMLSLDEGCVTSTVVKHELMHAIGFYHEQSRSDRDQYVIVHEDNIKPGKFANYLIKKEN